MAETTGFQRFIGGLLGEDVEGMTEEQRRRLTREGTTSAILGMLSGSGLIGGLESYGERRKKSAAEGEVARRQAAAEAMMPDITSLLFGGPTGTTIEALPGAGGEAAPLAARRVPTSAGARQALGMLYGTPAGREVAQMSPGLAEFAKEGTLGRTVGGSVYNPLTGGFTAPPKAPEAKTPVREVDLGGQVIVYFNDGTTQTFPKGMATGARAAGGGGGGAPMAAGGAPGAAMPTGILTPEQMRAVNPNFREGSVVYIDPKTGKPQMLQAGAATGAATAGNERMRTGQAMSRDAALQYAANITDTPIAEIRKKTPSEIEALMIKRGGRVLQGGRARTLAGLPGIGGIAKTVIDAANADLMAPATSGGAGIALTQNPTGPITGADVDVGRMQFPNAMYPIDVQAQMIRSILEQGGQVEEYDEKGNKVR
jgi:hypothetical protein